MVFGGDVEDAKETERYEQSLIVVQGSKLSTLLCSLFLGHLEQQHLHQLLPAGMPPPAPQPPSSSDSAGFTDLALAAGALPISGPPASSRSTMMLLCVTTQPQCNNPRH